MPDRGYNKIHGIPVLPQGAGDRYPICVRLPDAIRMTGLSRSRLYVLMSDGELEVIKVGRNTLIIVSSIVAFIDRQRASSRT
jgi:predicted DNA-binding transcriptional regulator AlpA